MIYHVCENNSRYKVISVTVSESTLCVRAFSPTAFCDTYSSYNQILSVDSLKNRCFSLDCGKYICSHEYVFNKSNPLQKAGNHIVFYTSILSQYEDEIYVDKIENIKTFNGITVIAELLCHDAQCAINDSDLMIRTSRNGYLYTNVPSDSLLTPTDEKFEFKCTLFGPTSVNTNDVFQATINMQSYSGNLVNAECEVDCISGYIPNRTVFIKNGNGKFRCSAFLVEDFVSVVFRNAYLRVNINE